MEVEKSATTATSCYKKPELKVILAEKQVRFQSIPYGSWSSCSCLSVSVSDTKCLVFSANQLGSAIFSLW